MNRKFTVIACAVVVLAVPAIAQVAKPSSPLPGAADVGRVQAGTYNVDTNHTQVVFTVNHMGISQLSGAFGASGGSLQLDPAKPTNAKVTVTFNMSDVSTTVAHFTEHLKSAEILDAVKYSTASFTSTSVVAKGTSATITGNLTLHGVTKPVTLDAKFFGAGTNPMSKKSQLGFSATSTIKRSDFGINYAAPVVPDDVVLHIHAAFEKAA